MGRQNDFRRVIVILQGIGFRSTAHCLQFAFAIRPAALRYGYNEVYVHGRNSR